MQSKTVARNVVLTILCVTGSCATPSAWAEPVAMRAATVSDGIEMTQPVSTSYIGGGPAWCHRIASFSPDHSEVVVVLRRGDVRRNLNHYELILWKTDELRKGKPRDVLHMSSSSTFPAIDPSSIVWSQDGQSLTFLGEHAGGHHEVFQINLITRDLRQLTYHSTNVISYSRDSTGKVMAYEANPPFQSIWNARTAQQGFLVTTQPLSALLRGRRGYAMLGRVAESQLFVQDQRGTRVIAALPGEHFRSDVLGRDNHGISVSPDGRYAVALETVPAWQIPDSWRKYDDWGMRLLLSGPEGGARFGVNDTEISHYVLINLQTDHSRILFNAPIMETRRILWTPDSQNIILSEVLLPERDQTSESAAIRTTVEVNVRTGVISRVGRLCHEALRWRRRGHHLTLVCDASPGWWGGADTQRSASSKITPSSTGCSDAKRVLFSQMSGTWRQIGLPTGPVVNIFVAENMNSPPSLYYKIKGQKKSRILLDLNPQLTKVRLATVKQVTWNWSKSRRISAGLYYPTNYVAGRRYPLVIQTHGWDPNRFWFFGRSSTAFAAQPLAAHGIFVLQLMDWQDLPTGRWSDHAQLKEVRSAIRIYRTAIDYLANRNLIDPRRVGIIGWSHTCFFVEWALTHDPKLFTAATVVDGEDGGYFQYIREDNDYVDVPSLYGGPPWGRSLKNWVKFSPGFNLNDVRAPIRIQGIHVWAQWELFDGLMDLGKPVELVLLDHDVHELKKPWNRIVSSGGDVQWFDFWLNGHKELHPIEVHEYQRWEHLCDIQRMENPDRPEFCVRSNSSKSTNKGALRDLSWYMYRRYLYKRYAFWKSGN